MATAPGSRELAVQARRFYVDALIVRMPGVVDATLAGTRRLIEAIADPVAQYRQRDTLQSLSRAAPTWLAVMKRLLQVALTARNAVVPTQRAAAPLSRDDEDEELSLVDNDTIETEIIGSRLALAMMDRASWQFSDLRSRMLVMEGRSELEPGDILRPHVLARLVTASWHEARLDQGVWRVLQEVLHDEFAHLVEEVCHEVNRWLVQHGVLPEVDLRPFIRRSAETHTGTTTGYDTMPGDSRFSVSSPARATDRRMLPAETDPTTLSADTWAAATSQVGEETRMLTHAGALAPPVEQAEALLGRLNRAVSHAVPGFVATAAAHSASPGLGAAIGDAERSMRERFAAAEHGGGDTIGTPALLRELAQRKQALKAAAATPVERATIEIVALLFQSLLTEERLPAAVRLWFARLQMPVLRVAVSEPDFFATLDHPARRLIDRMGSCVMGFDASARAVGDALEKEIKRVVQVVEAYPDTGRRVFQTVLTEFEKFLEHYFRNENEATRKGVSLAQQLEQRETLAIQYTIELRKMLNEVPVQEGIRDFLFQTWADVLATTAIKHGPQGDITRTMKRAASDLIWSAGAKVSREERAEVLRRLPLLLKTLRIGMEEAGIPHERQDEHIRQLNNSLAAAFTAKAAVIAPERLEELTARLDTLEELLPDADELPIDDAMMLDLSGHESDELEVVGDGGSMPTPGMLAWARELQVGGWYMLDYRNRNEPVQLAWQGMRRQLALFVSPQGRGILFPQQRLAAFLQAGLLVPAQEESLTVRATRSALAKLDVDPARLLN